MSLCGGHNKENTPTTEQFDEHLISYEQFVNDPAIYKNPNLVFRINGQMYSWETACPQILSLALFGKAIPAVSDFWWKIKSFVFCNSASFVLSDFSESDVFTTIGMKKVLSLQFVYKYLISYTLLNCRFFIQDFL